MKIGISYGVLSESIYKQLKNQGIKVIKKEIKPFQQCKEAIEMLVFGPTEITDSVRGKLTERLHDKLIKHLNKEKTNGTNSRQ